VDIKFVHIVYSTRDSPPGILPRRTINPLLRIRWCLHLQHLTGRYPPGLARHHDWGNNVKSLRSGRIPSEFALSMLALAYWTTAQPIVHGDVLPGRHYHLQTAASPPQHALTNSIRGWHWHLFRLRLCVVPHRRFPTQWNGCCRVCCIINTFGSSNNGTQLMALRSPARCWCATATTSYRNEMSAQNGTSSGELLYQFPPTSLAFPSL
jgi:hypothetical protein